MNQELNRRKFLGAAAATGAFSLVQRHVLGGRGFVAPNDKIALAHIGMGTQGFNELGGLLEDPGIQIVAVCDPNRESYDYVEWGKHSIRNLIRGFLGDPRWAEGKRGCPGGRDIGKLVVETYYAKHGRGEGFKGCATYADFRELLEKEKDLDAVKIMTPDHLHATIAVAAMKRGLHVLMHKPMANRFTEGRLVAKVAKETGVATHLLAYGSGTENGRIVERIREGVIGNLREVHCWTNRPVWPQYTEIPKDRPPVPAGLDWDLWLGPAQDRAYHPHYTHTVFRGWYDFGGGSMADMGIYALWPVFTGLGLGVARSAESLATHTCVIEDGVSHPTVNDFAYPTACTLRFRFAAGPGRSATELFWYDGGMRPRLPAEVEAQEVATGAEGILFLGQKGCILADFLGQNARLFAGGKVGSLWEGAPAREPMERRQRTNPWIQAVRGGEPSPGSFLEAASITDTVNLGTVALRARAKVALDTEVGRITNLPEANRFLTREYRRGWELAS